MAKKEVLLENEMIGEEIQSKTETPIIPEIVEKENVIKLNNKEVLIEDIISNELFKTDLHTANKYYSDETKFKILKKK